MARGWAAARALPMQGAARDGNLRGLWNSGIISLVIFITEEPVVKPRLMMPVCLMMLSIALLAWSLAGSATPAPSGGEHTRLVRTASPEATLPPIVPGTEAVPDARAARP